ncbi:MAG: DEAD/DEAH box helicase [Thermoleophilia bacterium]|nr:DEAD/DEAH box helicase [Thermoleophilia bacterium]
MGRWFREALGEPTPPQRDGWPLIAAGRNTLICAPTGSGKTLAAFLAALDLLWRDPAPARGVKILYISPLKALNEDVSRNLLGPLEGILRVSEEDGEALRPLTVGVRSGDTPQAERQRLVRRPPDVLITTPESLHLLLASRARETLRTVTHVIVDEIHAVCGNKRGASSPSFSNGWRRSPGMGSFGSGCRPPSVRWTRWPVTSAGLGSRPGPMGGSSGRPGPSRSSMQAGARCWTSRS